MNTAEEIRDKGIVGFINTEDVPVVAKPLSRADAALKLYRQMLERHRTPSRWSRFRSYLVNVATSAAKWI